MSGNTARGYGSKVATGPARLIASEALLSNGAAPITAEIKAALAAAGVVKSSDLNKKNTYLPGQEALDIQLLLLDGLGQVPASTRITNIFKCIVEI